MFYFLNGQKQRFATATRTNFNILLLVTAICSLEKVSNSDANKNTTQALSTQTPITTCPLNEEWKECAYKVCPGSYKPQGFCSERFARCSDVPPCKPGSGLGACICKEGYTRAIPFGPCIPENKCCNEMIHEVWAQCGIACQDVCGQTIRICPHFCPSEGGCVCHIGYIRNAPGGKCIPQDKCPCPKYEVISNSTNWCCKNYMTCSNMSPVCNKDCMPGGGCVCATGYIRKSVGGTCVPIKSCSHSCPANEHWQACARPSCEPNCGNRTPICPKIDFLCQQGEGACVCNNGLIRLGPKCKCISVKKCPLKTCTKYEVFSNSTVWCCENEKTCSNSSPVCNKACPLGGGCICATGYVRKSVGGMCIDEHKCFEDNECN